ncbi:MAG: isopentenyl-diphosphate Delta-isomerase [Candidatus Moranbacteria bacterium]|nr:isopentenyl-diphosphate Delta-isomerase [Candidatus Moranbacteria bacterium]
MRMSEELVVLVDDDDNEIGTMPKAEVHGLETPLHRGFSCFLFRRSDGKLLLQQRSHVKKTWPLVWSNTCCGHPGPGEERIDAVARRLDRELGMKADELRFGIPYRYKFTREGVTENEICPVFVGFAATEPSPAPDEVEATRWIDWDEFLTEIREHPGTYSDWCEEETLLLEESGIVLELLGEIEGV